MPVPAWVQDAVFYQIFPDRFANGDPGNDPPNVQPWGSPPDRWHYQGGDLRGITERLDYLSDLGVNAIYLNPIFLSSANHRYHTIDYFKIDPFLGTLENFQQLLGAAHRKGMRVILDGVLNHCGRGFFAFADVLENNAHSPYVDWFHIKRFPLKAYRRGKARNYKGWWDIKDLPKFNSDNAGVRDYLFGMTRYWLEQGIDGWRLDVPNEIDNDDFWGAYRQLVKSINPEAYLVGEIWDLDPRWVGDGHFDGLMNYPLREAIVDVLRGKLHFDALAGALTSIKKTFAPEHFSAMYNLLGSHDTRRLLTKLRGHRAKTRLAYAALFSLPGAPAIYYGEEIGLRGGAEPASRGAFPWEEERWDMELRSWIQKLIALRHEHAVLRRGGLELVAEPGINNVLAARRRHADGDLLAVMNFSDKAASVSIDWGSAQAVDLLSGGTFSANSSKIQINLPAWGAVWLVEKAG